MSTHSSCASYNAFKSCLFKNVVAQTFLYHSLTPKSVLPIKAFARTVPILIFSSLKITFKTRAYRSVP